VKYYSPQVTKVVRIPVPVTDNTYDVLSHLNLTVLTDHIDGALQSLKTPEQPHVYYAVRIDDMNLSINDILDFPFTILGAQPAIAVQVFIYTPEMFRNWQA
jgi:hypothetical protein